MDRGPVLGFQSLFQGFRFLAVAQVARNDCRSVASQQRRSCASESARPSGHQNHTTPERILFEIKLNFTVWLRQACAPPLTVSINVAILSSLRAFCFVLIDDWCYTRSVQVAA